MKSLSEVERLMGRSSRLLPSQHMSAYGVVVPQSSAAAYGHARRGPSCKPRKIPARLAGPSRPGPRLYFPPKAVDQHGPADTLLATSGIQLSEQPETLQEVAQDEVRVSIRTNREVAFGDSVRIVGEGSQLGDWNATAAPEMKWAEGHDWVASFSLPPGSYLFKCVVVHEDGTAGEWEGGANRTLQVDAVGKAVEVLCPWNDTEATVINPAQDGAVTDTDGHEAPGNGTGPGIQHQVNGSNDAEHLSDLSALFTGEDQETPESTSEQPGASTTDAADPLVPGGSDGWGAAKGGEGGSLDEGDIEQADPGAPSTTAEQTDEAVGQGSVKQPLSSPAPPAQVSEKPDPTPPSPISPSASTTADSTPSAATISQEDTHQGSEQGAVQSGVPAWLLATVTLAAVPVVLWSEFTLKITGCGLPPGPGGSLGAAEGVSYVAVAVVALWSLISRISARGKPSAGGGEEPAWENAAIGSLFATIAAGLVVLGFQVQDYGYIPAALPDSKCHGEPDTSSSASSPWQGSVAAAPALQQVQGKVAHAVNASRDSLGSSHQVFEIAASSTGSGLAEGLQDAPRGVTQGVESLAGTMSEAGTGLMDKFRGFMSFQQEQQQELQSGAVDGLSSADLTAVVDELSAAAGRIKHLIVDGLARVMHSSGPGWLAPHSSVESAAGLAHLPLGFLQLPQMTLADLGMGPTAGNDTCPPEAHLPRWLSTGDLTFMAAATNAVTAANNVNTQLNSVALELQSSVDNVRTIIDDATLVARTDSHLDVAQLTNMMSTLERALGTAQERANRLDLQPLATQLHEAAGKLRQSANGSSALVNPIAERLDTAAGDLIQAAAAANPAQIEATRARLAGLATGKALQNATTSPAPTGEAQGPLASGPDSLQRQASSRANAEIQEAVEPAVEAADSVASKLQQVVNRIRHVEPVLGHIDNLQEPVQTNPNGSNGDGGHQSSSLQAE